MRTAIVVAALLHQAVCFVAPPVRVAPSLRVSRQRGPRPTTTRPLSLAAVEDDATPKRRPLRGLWRRIRRKKTEEPSEPEPEQPPLKVGEQRRGRGDGPERQGEPRRGERLVSSDL